MNRVHLSELDAPGTHMMIVQNVRQGIFCSLQRPHQHHDAPHVHSFTLEVWILIHEKTAISTARPVKTRDKIHVTPAAMQMLKFSRLRMLVNVNQHILISVQV